MAEYMEGHEALQDAEAEKMREEETRAFTEAGWERYNPAQSFIDTVGEDGAKMTLASQKTEGGDSGWQIEGDVTPPEDVWKKRTVFEYSVEDSNWNNVLQENAE